MKTIVFLDSECLFIEHYVETLRMKGYRVEVYTCEEKLISDIKNKCISADLIITELILEGSDFNGKRNGFFDDCASLLYDELEQIEFKGKVVILTKYEDTKTFFEVKNREKFSNILSKSISINDLADIVEEILSEQ